MKIGRKARIDEKLQGKKKVLRFGVLAMACTL